MCDGVKWWSGCVCVCDGVSDGVGGGVGVQWNLQITDTLGQGLLSIIQRYPLFRADFFSCIVGAEHDYRSSRELVLLA